jgi:acetoin utilization protein AcuC
LLAEASCVPVDPDTPIPAGWVAHLRAGGVRGELPATMGERPVPDVRPWEPGGEGWLDAAIGATRRAAFPLLGLDPYDPRD